MGEHAFGMVAKNDEGHLGFLGSHCTSLLTYCHGINDGIYIYKPWREEKQFYHLLPHFPFRLTLVFFLESCDSFLPFSIPLGNLLCSFSEAGRTLDICRNGHIQRALDVSHIVPKKQLWWNLWQTASRKILAGPICFFESYWPRAARSGKQHHAVKAYW